MAKIIRNGTFETNSSSSHSLTIVSKQHQEQTLRYWHNVPAQAKQKYISQNKDKQNNAPWGFWGKIPGDSVYTITLTDRAESIKYGYQAQILHDIQWKAGYIAKCLMDQQSWGYYEEDKYISNKDARKMFEQVIMQTDHLQVDYDFDKNDCCMNQLNLHYLFDAFESKQRLKDLIYNRLSFIEVCYTD